MEYLGRRVRDLEIENDQLKAQIEKCKEAAKGEMTRGGERFVSMKVHEERMDEVKAQARELHESLRRALNERDAALNERDEAWKALGRMAMRYESRGMPPTEAMIRHDDAAMAVGEDPNAEREA